MAAGSRTFSVVAISNPTETGTFSDWKRYRWLHLQATGYVEKPTVPPGVAGFSAHCVVATFGTSKAAYW